MAMPTTVPSEQEMTTASVKAIIGSRIDSISNSIVKGRNGKVQRAPAQFAWAAAREAVHDDHSFLMTFAIAARDEPARAISIRDFC